LVKALGDDRGLLVAPFSGQALITACPSVFPLLGGPLVRLRTPAPRRNGRCRSGQLVLCLKVQPCTSRRSCLLWRCK
jgi:hypothetical protein